MLTFFDFDSAAPVWTPASLFSGGFTGMWLDYSDKSSMWQDLAKTTPVAADGDPIYVIECQVGGPDWVAPNSGARPIYHEGGGLSWAAGGILGATFGAITSVSAFTKAVAHEWSNVTGNRCTDAGPGATHLIQLNTYQRSLSAPAISGQVSPHTFAINTPYTSIQVFDGSLAATHADRNKFYRDNSQITWATTNGTINSTSNSGTAFGLGASNLAGTAPFAGNVSQWIMINKAIDSTERGELDLFLKAKQGR
jgi:hypothetical protein